MTREEIRSARLAYLALLDTLLRAAALEDAKAAAGPDAMACWAVVAVPRWQAVSAELDAVEAAQPAETWGWYLAWRDEQDRGRAGGSSPARTRVATMASPAPERAILPVAQLRLG